MTRKLTLCLLTASLALLCVSANAQISATEAATWGPNNPPPGMIYVPGGSFIQGGPDNDNERPFGLFVTTQFFIDKTEVTNASFTRVMPQHRFPKGQENYPASSITYTEAEEYAEKVSRLLPAPWKKMLPTEEQWEKAARATEGYFWPWGGIWDPSRANCSGTGPKPVGSYPQGASPYGCLDMIGNVWEWTRTPYHLPGVSVSRYPNYVLKGGSWWPYSPTPNCYTRYHHAPEVSTALIGFRLVMPIPDELRI